MEKRVLELDVETKKAEKGIGNVTKGVDGLTDALKKAGNQAEKVEDKVSAPAKKNLFGKMSGGAKKFAGGLGKIVKGAGIFGVIALALGKLTELFQQNSKIMNIFNVGFEAMSLMFSDFVNFFSENVGTVIDYFKAIFENPVESMKSFANAIKENIINRIKSTIETFGHLADVVKNLITFNFDEAGEAAKRAGSSFVDSMTGVPNTIDKVTEVMNEVIPAITDYVSSTLDAAQANVDLAKEAEIAMARNQGLLATYNQQAEQQRQIRDDIRLSIEDRKKANEELLTILDKQQKVMLDNAQKQLDLANLNLAKDKDSKEFIIAQIQAKNELAAVEEAINGQKSEQLTNQAALEKELLDLTQSQSEAQNARGISAKRADAEMIIGASERLQAMKLIDAEEKKMELDRLKSVVESTNTGTQARVDAEQALLDAKEQFRQQDQARDQEINQQKIADEQAVQDAKFALASSALGSLSTLVDAYASKGEKQAKKAFNVQKALGMAQVGINTAQAIMKAASETTDITPIQAFRTANMIAMGVAGAAQMVAIGMQKFNSSGSSAGGGGGSTSVSTPSQPTAPSFNVVGQSGTNQIAEAVNAQSNSPVQAYVVAGDVSTAQQLENNTIQQATF